MTEKSYVKVTLLFITWKICNVGGNSMLGKKRCMLSGLLCYEPLRDSSSKDIPGGT